MSKDHLGYLGYFCKIHWSMFSKNDLFEWARAGSAGIALRAMKPPLQEPKIPQNAVSLFKKITVISRNTVYHCDECQTYVYEVNIKKISALELGGTTMQS